MSIHDFHSQLSTRNENPLFDALRRLRRVENIRTLLLSNETLAGGWYPWEGAENQQHSMARA